MLQKWAQRESGDFVPMNKLTQSLKNLKQYLGIFTDLTVEYIMEFPGNYR